MRSVVPPDEKRGIGKNTKPFNQGIDLVEMGARALPLEAGAQPSCSRSSNGIFLSELVLFFPRDCGCSTDAQGKHGGNIFVKPVHRRLVPIGTESPTQPGTRLGKALPSLPESRYEDTFVACSPRPSPLHARLTTAVGMLPVRLTCEGGPVRVLLSRMGTPSRREVSEARPGSPGPILTRFAPKPDVVWRENNGGR
jgi:hypothetical protein